MKYLRRNKIYHRDLKPQNILFSDSTQTFKITDFGISKKLRDGEDFDKYVHSTYTGTPLYMAPEMLEKQTYSSNTDIWSLGIIMYRLTQGHVPYLANTPFDLLTLLKRKKNQELYYPFPISKSSQNFIQKCLKYDWKKRFTWKKVFEYEFKNDE